jgi:tripartite-type tricarboxylate transporter receptor subunit TctC
MLGPAFVFDPIFNPDTATIDPREVNFLVSFSNYPSYCATTVASGITTFDQLITTPGVNVGAVSNSTSFFAANAINRAFDADFNIVTGFAGISEIYLALARGELAAFCGLSHSSIAATEATVDINIVAELSPEPLGLVEGAEFILDRMEDPTTRDALGLVFSPNTIFYPMMAHPDTPDDVVAELRDALFALATDEAFLAEMTTRGIDLRVTHGADVQVLVDQFLNADPVIQAAARALVQ